LEYEAGELAFTNDFDQARHLQLFNVMRESRGAHVVDSAQLVQGVGSLHAAISLSI
jgi:hypothetical protein